MQQENHFVIFCIDLKSFYASCECIKRDLDPFKTNLVVASLSRGPASIVLAVSPFLKNQGVPSRCRIKELPKNLDIIYANPSMQHYIDVSVKIISIYLDFISEEDMHIYSIDEVFLDVSKYFKLYNCTPKELAEKILKKIYTETKIIATCGIGDSLFMAKMALDNDAKNNAKDDYIAYWRKGNMDSKLWLVKPLSKMWGIGKNLEQRLNNLNIYSVYDLAHYDVNILKNKFGIIGEELYYHANGVDHSIISHKIKSSGNKSFSVGQVLMKDYTKKMIIVVFKEMVDELALRLRKENKIGNCFRLSMQYSYKQNEEGFSRQIKLPQYTNDEKIIYDYLMILFNRFYNNQLIRKVTISISGLVNYDFLEMNLFEEEEKIKKYQDLANTIDSIKNKYGNDKITKASAQLKESTYKLRTKLIGGHNAK